MAVEDRTIDDLGLVVLDELHMVEDENRGFLLEILAAKLLSLGQRVQIVGMSATLSVHPFLSGILFELMSVEHRDGGEVAQCQSLRMHLPPGALVRTHRVRFRCLYSLAHARKYNSSIGHQGVERPNHKCIDHTCSGSGGSKPRRPHFLRISPAMRRSFTSTANLHGHRFR